MKSISLCDFFKFSDAEVDELLFDEEYIDIVDGESSKSYKILKNEKQLVGFLHGIIQHESRLIEISYKQGGVSWDRYTEFGLVNFDIKQMPNIERILNNCSNIIFAKKVFLNQYKENQYLNFSHCKFKEFTSFGKREINKKQSLLINNCTINKQLVFNGNIEFVDITHSDFLSRSVLSMLSVNCDSFQAIDSKLSCSIQNSDVKKINISNCEMINCNIINVATEKKLVISECTIASDSRLHFENYILDGYGKISFKEVKGKVVFFDTILHRTSFDFKSLKKQGYKCLEYISGGKIDHTETARSFNVLYNTARQNNDNEYYLEFEFLEKMHSLKAEKQTIVNNRKYLRFPKWLLSRLYQSSLAYFCYWKRILLTIALTILSFSLAYALNPNKILIDGKVKFDDTLINLLLAGKINAMSLLDILSSSVYFSLITFTNGGYGNISPIQNGYFKYFVAMEGLFGVILISFLTVSIVRRFAR